MNIEIELETEAGFGFDHEDVIRKAVNGSAGAENCPYEISVNVLLTDEESIRELNRNFRGIDSATDVLSFPAVDFGGPCDYDVLETDEGDMYFDPDTGDLVLGDIAISIPRVKSQAQEYGHSERRELAFLVVHSMLHLLGYDHMEEEDRLLMEERQRVIMDLLGIGRDS